MAAFLSNLRRSGSPDDLAELQQLVTRLDSQRASLEQLVQHADRSIGQLQRLGTLGERVNTLERQLAGIEHLAGRLGAAESQLAGLTGTHNRLETQMAETSTGIEQARVDVTLLTETVAATVRLKEELSGFLSLKGPFSQLRGEMDGLQSQNEVFRADFSRLREQHDATLSSYRAAAGRIESFDGEWQRITRTVTETKHRIAGLEQLLGDMAPIAESAAQIRRQLIAAKALADQLGQKVALLEQQRDEVDRATAKLEHLTALMQRVDQGAERSAEAVRTVAALRAELEDLHEAQNALTDRSRSVTERLERIESGQVSAERALVGLREGLDQSTERLALESRSVEGMGQRVGDLRRNLAEWETRFATLAAGAETITAAAARADTLSSQVADLTGELARVAELGHRVRAGLGDLERLEEGVGGLTERTCRLEESRPLLERTVRDLAGLGATEEAIHEALEQLRGARQELAETRGSLDQTRTWLGDTERSVSSLRTDVASLDRMRSTVDSLRQELEQLTGQMSVVESRKGLVDEVQRRLTEAAGMGASIEARARGLAERLEAAEDHIGTLVPRLDEVGRAGNQLVSLGAEVREMEERVRAVQGTVHGVETRAHGLETLANRMQELSREIDQRQHALTRATEHLDRAATLRQEAAAAAQTLADRAREVDTALANADQRLTTCDSLSRELESRIGVLSTAQERITGFETKLAEWRGAEQQLAQAMEQATARQATITSLQSEIRALFDLAERTQADARAVTGAQPQMARARAELDALLARLGDTDGIMQTLEGRRRQLDKTEERLAHADLLATDVRATLETLVAQKAQVDHFLGMATALSLETRRVEGLLEALRDERRLSDKVHASLAGLRRQGE
jgi:chromosome segregation ATPase